jgi:cell division protein YceG involved in septum cleavage
MPNSIRSKIARLFVSTLTLLFLLAGIAVAAVYLFLFKSSYNTFIDKQVKVVAIHRGMSYPQILKTLKNEGVIKHIEPMLFLARLMPEAQRIKPGRY